MKKLTFLFLLLPFLVNAQPDAGRISSISNYAYSRGDSSAYALLIDMSVPSNQKRLFLVQLTTQKIVYSTYVAHGSGSGEGAKAVSFSDQPGGHCTSLGHYMIGDNYIGKHGSSYRLIGLDKTNENAMDRDIVIHSAWYVEKKFIREYGRCGNSWGCPAVSKEALNYLEPYLAKNTMVWIYK